MKFRTVMKKTVSVVAAGTMVLSLAACGTKDSGDAKEKDNGDSGSGDGVTLEFQQWWGVELPDGALAEICEKFTEDTGITIELLSNPYADTKTQIASGAAAGTMADVVGLDGSWVYDFAKQGSIANLTELMKESGYDDSQLSDQIKYEGNTYMIPVVNFAYPMYVNMDILEAAGVSELPATRTEFIDACKKVKAYDDNIAGWAIPLSTESPSGIQNQFMSWVWASGGSMLKDGKPNLTDNTDMEKAVEFVKQLNDEGVIAKGAYAMKEADMVEEFTNGRVAFMTDGVSHLSTIKKEAPDLNVDFMKLPVEDGYTGESGMDVANWGIGIAENCENKKEAMQFVEYLMGPEVNAELSVLANAFPGNSKAQPDYSESDELFKKAYELFKECYAINEFTGLPTSEELMRGFDEQLQLYLDGDTASAKDMLKATDEVWSPAFGQ
ncbi:ABC transporter substrate-binding protein [Faecalicatena contorta]|uniref:Carbohydrate ABC transporter substrate-binding protein, CUT1 family n=1 Tax=Faecalicatena contorta TaxID=39482 RepID=A0A315ZR64_9FIRM|nr:sugar ABC transporter substrate-binding protein [Faecalicatena contorta]PWJ47164.1 carbohydrate ABC transporter substrate-binding protein (CUT1 family) [Faecalicatena contorta]SUQ16139.1 carbohydrate ABC transporter substrate-binding protein, CUT1 family [Faecalicatena contorta]